MSGRLAGKVALVTGAARGQGRSHAVHLAREGADVMLVDLCADIPTTRYPLATVEDLDQTARQVEKLERRAVILRGDVRDRKALEQAVALAVSELGGLDVVVANAGIAPLGADGTAQTFVDSFDVDFVGVVNTFSAAIPHLPEGASLIATGSVAAIRGAVDNPASGPGGAGYALAKTMIVQYTKALAKQLAPQKIRVNAVHPTNCNTDMLHNDGMYRLFRPDLEHPVTEDVMDAFGTIQAMPIPYVDPADVSHAVVYLASDESRYVTGLQLTVDAGAAL
ncbi:SDR family mycofactocin-dependent oxidoreductase [Mycolicibacterium duvalii]|uniref:3-ketoacyl-ACP reductase n=1 Tax=Mycolicibacterium duvalii TaxID=39688 RepID=A0A7I7K0H1_9MYCO|nr:mycofactocin-coupled SDR family oxidoreductase [Mycolicibacterium duvalii]MCV7370810.1 mycofactocin-coupled SDR family oxidoreductase [Mycolicibacterium duvalii]PEG41368.1 SDR family mycofactocin-dependent oxidoreductase [Mycolicibacterium duvalii]BBX17058.1 3-ketoacyl-ACP reductase [Mycolicibacterium duvalii]